jgi:hypothetical protein
MSVQDLEERDMANNLRSRVMKVIGKLALGAVMMGGVAVAAASPASAAVSIGIGIPGPVYAHPYYGGCYDPYHCGYPAYYGGPAYYHGYWGAPRFGWHAGWRGDWQHWHR